MNGFMKFCMCVVAFFAIAVAVTLQFAHKLENQNLAIVQSMTGDVDVRKTAGWWIQVSPTITEYPKAGIYRLNSKDRDSLEIQFKNKSTATLNVNIGYRIDGASNETLIALHQQVEGQEEKIWTMLLTALNTMAQSVTTKYDPSDVIGGDKFDTMIKEMHTAIMHNEELLKHGIDVNYFAVDGRPIPDPNTKAQFDKQREADLAKRLAEAESLKLEAETIRTKAQYDREIAEFKGKADAETAKLKTEAERQKELATIEAQKKVEVAKLEKEQATIEIEKTKEVAKIEAEKLREVAEIEKATEAARLEKAKLIAQQKITEAEAKQVCIEKSGAITELQQAELEYGFKREAVKWENIGKGIAQTKLPQMWVAGGNGTTGGVQNPIELLVNTMTLEKLNSIAAPAAKPTK